MGVDRRGAMLGAAAAGLGTRGLAAVAGEQVDRIALWPDEPPGRLRPITASLVERSTVPGVHDRALSGIGHPHLDVFRAAQPNGAGALIMPGGGYARVVIDREGHELARFLAARGVSAFVLFYRLPAEGWAAGPDVALADAQRAMRLIRSRADAFAIDADRIAAIGFSAGGHVCGDLATRYAARVADPVDAIDRQSARPALAATLYPVVTMTTPHAHGGSRENLIGADASPAVEARHSVERNVHARTPPLFIVHAEDDTTVPVANALMLREAARHAGVSVDSHLFAEGGHGFGIGRAGTRPVAAWPDLLHRWGQGKGVFGWAAHLAHFIEKGLANATASQYRPRDSAGRA